MKKIGPILTICMTLIIIIISCSETGTSETDSSQFKNDSIAIQNAFNKILQGINNENFEDYITSYTNDNIQMSPGSPNSIGIDNFRSSVNKFLEKYTYHVDELDVYDILISGDLAVARASYTATSTSKENGESETSAHKWVTVWQKQLDNSWKIKWEIYNDEARQANYKRTPAYNMRYNQLPVAQFIAGAPPAGQPGKNCKWFIGPRADTLYERKD